MTVPPSFPKSVQQVRFPEHGKAVIAISRQGAVASRAHGPDMFQAHEAFIFSTQAPATSSFDVSESWMAHT